MRALKDISAKTTRKTIHIILSQAGRLTIPYAFRHACRLSKVMREYAKATKQQQTEFVIVQNDLGVTREVITRPDEVFLEPKALVCIVFFLGLKV